MSKKVYRALPLMAVAAGLLMLTACGGEDAKSDGPPVPRVALVGSVTGLIADQLGPLPHDVACAGDLPQVKGSIQECVFQKDGNWIPVEVVYTGDPYTRMKITISTDTIPKPAYAG